MPILVLEESNYAGPIPEDSILPARVTGVKQITKKFKDDDGNDIHRMEFSFVVEDPDGVYDGQRLWGDTPITFNTHPECRLRAWAQELFGTELPKGFVLDTDDLKDKRCRVVVALKIYQKEGEEKTRNFVKDLIRPKGGGDFAAVGAVGVEDDEPF